LLGNPQQRRNQEHIREIFKAHHAQGAALRIQALDRALLLVKDLPGVRIEGGLSEWTAEKPSRDVVLQVNSQDMQSADLLLDNAGARSTGRERALANFRLSNLTGRGDQATLTALRTDGSTYLRGEVSWPLGYHGWRLSLYDAHLSYRLVAPEFVASNAQGTSNTLGLSATYPVVRTSVQNLFANFQVERKGFDNQVNGATESQYKSTLMGAGLSANANDAWEGFSTASLQWVHGQLNLNGSPTQSRDAAGAQTAGRFGKAQYSLTRVQPIASRWEAYAAFNGQWASKNLDSSEKFTLGGENGVRAYPGSEGVGAQGQVANLELRWRATSTDTLLGFYDWGQVTLLRDIVSAAALNTYALKGAGLGWHMQLPGNARIKFSWARRIGNNPNPSNTGTDQDGSLIRNRYWLSASVPFAL
jgi:hemolysin activation/secretion protein